MRSGDLVGSHVWQERPELGHPAMLTHSLRCGLHCYAASRLGKELRWVTYSVRWIVRMGYAGRRGRFDERGSV